MQTVLLNNGTVTNVGSTKDALELVRDNVSLDVAEYLEGEIRTREAERDLAIEELQECSKLCRSIRICNDELKQENNKMHCEIIKLRDELNRKSTQ